MPDIPINAELVAHCGLYCGSCKAHLAGKCPGCNENAKALATIHRALDSGLTMIDSADDYGSGHNERLMSRALKGRCNDSLIATKFGIVFDPA